MAGSFSFGSLVAGDYFAAAIPDEFSSEYSDPAYLESLRRGAERLSFHEGHRVPEQVAVLARAQHRHDVRMMQLRGQHDLSAKALAIDAGREVGLQHFHDDSTAERLLDRDEDTAHAAAGQLAVDDVVRGQRFLKLAEKGVGHWARG